MTMRQYNNWVLPVVGALFAVLTLIPFTSYAVSCEFTRDLQLGSVGEDVRCLQQYLNSNGYQIATAGVGAPGKETGDFQSLTKAAVSRWQQDKGISPATGYFGAKSRSVFSGGSVTPSTKPTTTNASGNALVDELLAKINALQGQQTKPTTATPPKVTVPSKPENKELKDLMADALDALDVAKEAIEDSEEDSLTINEAEDALEDAEDDFFDAIRAYVDGDEDEAEDLLKDTIEAADEATADAGGNSMKTQADEAIDDAEERMDDAEVAIEEAQDDGDDTDEAEDLFEEAEDVLDEARDAFDDDDYDEAIDLAEEAEDLLKDAEDAIGSGGGSSDVEDMLDEARDDLEDARDDVDTAIDDGDDVGDAEDLLDDAEDLLDEAEEALDDDDEDEAEDLIDEALDLIDEALDEF